MFGPIELPEEKPIWTSQVPCPNCIELNRKIGRMGHEIHTYRLNNKAAKRELVRLRRIAKSLCEVLDNGHHCQDWLTIKSSDDRFRYRLFITAVKELANQLGISELDDVNQNDRLNPTVIPDTSITEARGGR